MTDPSSRRTLRNPPLASSHASGADLAGSDVLGCCPGCDLPGPVATLCVERGCSRRGLHCVPVAWVAGVDPHRDPVIGRVVDGHLVVALLGAGGFGRVYLALNLSDGEALALKLFSVDGGAEEPEPSVEREALALASLDHPNVVRLVRHGVWADRGRHLPYLLMEYVPGGRSLEDALAERFEADEGFGCAWTGAVLRQLLSGLAAAHELGIVHRDVKPENVMIQDGARAPEGCGAGPLVRLLDFGLAKFVHADARNSQILGTPTHMAPEQLHGGRVGPWTDLYAVGVMAFELLTASAPFDGATPEDVLRQRADLLYDPLARVGPLPEACEVFFRRALAFEPEDRFQTVAEMSEALEVALAAWPEGVGASAGQGAQRVATSAGARESSAGARARGAARVAPTARASGAVREAAGAGARAGGAERVATGVGARGDVREASGAGARARGAERVAAGVGARGDAREASGAGARAGDAERVATGVGARGDARETSGAGARAGGAARVATGVGARGDARETSGAGARAGGAARVGSHVGAQARSVKRVGSSAGASGAVREASSAGAAAGASGDGHVAPGVGARGVGARGVGARGVGARGAVREASNAGASGAVREASNAGASGAVREVSSAGASGAVREASSAGAGARGDGHVAPGVGARGAGRAASSAGASGAVREASSAGAGAGARGDGHVAPGVGARGEVGVALGAARAGALEGPASSAVDQRRSRPFLDWCDRLLASGAWRRAVRAGAAGSGPAASGPGVGSSPPTEAHEAPAGGRRGRHDTLLTPAAVVAAAGGGVDGRVRPAGPVIAPITPELAVVGGACGEASQGDSPDELISPRELVGAAGTTAGAACRDGSATDTPGDPTSADGLDSARSATMAVADEGPGAADRAMALGAGDGDGGAGAAAAPGPPAEDDDEALFAAGIRRWRSGRALGLAVAAGLLLGLGLLLAPGGGDTGEVVASGAALALEVGAASEESGASDAADPEDAIAEAAAADAEREALELLARARQCLAEPGDLEALASVCSPERGCFAAGALEDLRTWQDVDPGALASGGGTLVVALGAQDFSSAQSCGARWRRSQAVVDGAWDFIDASFGGYLRPQVALQVRRGAGRAVDERRVALTHRAMTRADLLVIQTELAKKADACVALPPPAPGVDPSPIHVRAVDEVAFHGVGVGYTGEEGVTPCALDVDRVYFLSAPEAATTDATARPGTQLPAGKHLAGASTSVAGASRPTELAR